MAKVCQWDKEPCHQSPVSGEKYCKGHRKMMIARMEDEGYLQPVPRSSEPQPFIPHREEENDG